MVVRRVAPRRGRRAAPPARRRTADDLIRLARIGRLATADRNGQPHVVPVCFAYDDGAVYIPIDEKPKRVAPRRLRRVRNIEVNPQVALVIDHYEENWTRLRFVLISGTAQMIAEGREYGRALVLLRRKYPQYRAMRLENNPVIKISPQRVVGWAATPPAPGGSA
ncbi:MAG TPA: TIGR03668 family PPOX class F420-dependent oxidoreductase [Gemmatimonadales bacterium]|nr:TIGR03668 family PPOX class F420-dependent oxidoreductase [Gemmatimonadales bacterium]